MSVVVGCERCKEISQVPARSQGKLCKLCRRPRRLLLTVEDNQERWRRGIPLDEWFAAPHAPAKRAECEDGERPCPFLRCRYHLGNVGDRGCALDVSDRGGITLRECGDLIGLTEDGASKVELAALAKKRTKEGKPL